MIYFYPLHQRRVMYLVPTRRVGMHQGRAASCNAIIITGCCLPVSSAMPVLSVAEGDGNLAALQILSNTKFHIPVSGFRHPCRNDGVSQALVYNDERSAWERGRA